MLRGARFRLRIALLAAAPALVSGCVRCERPEPLPRVRQTTVESGALSRAERALAAFSAGLDLELAGRADAALECYRGATGLAPDEAVYRARLGQVLMRSGRGAEGAGHLRRAQELGVRALAVYQALAEHYLKQGKSDLSAAEFEKMLPELAARGPATEVPVLRLALFLVSHYEHEGRPADAARIGAFLAGRFPKRPEFRLEHAKNLLAARREHEALAEVAAFEKLLPGSSAGARMLALHYSDRGRPGEALNYAERCLVKLRADPAATAGDLVTMRHFRADLLGKVELFDEARKELRGLLAEAADDGARVEALVALAYLDRAAGRPADAVKRTRGALAGGMKSGRLHAALAAALGDLGKFDEAERAYHRAQRLYPRDIHYRLSLAALLEKRGQHPRAAAELRAALAVKPGDPTCSGRLARLYVRRGVDLDEAARLAESALEAEPAGGGHLAVLGRVRYRQGRVEAARKLLERAVLHEPAAESLEWLGDAYFALGLWRRARSSWEQALARDPKRAGARRKLERLKAAG